MDTREIVARFESERQALALMNHPAIARVFDGGSTPEGRPFFVMEYIAGIPITQHCDVNRLPIRVSASNCFFKSVRASSTRITRRSFTGTSNRRMY